MMCGKGPAKALLLALVFPAVSACGSSDGPGPQPETPTPTLRTETNEYGLITCSPADDEKTCFTNRAVMGVSMGAHGAGAMGFRHPELVDTVGMLGVPLVDWAYMLRLISRSHLGGFCDYETLVANVDNLVDPETAPFCGPVQGTELLEPSGRLMEASQDFNHWYRGMEAGRGGNFGRNDLRESFQDLALAFGNAFYYNEDSPYLPPGVPRSYMDATDAERCANPPVIEGLYHKEYNPKGEYPVIPVCDTRTSEGEYNPDRPSEVSFEMLLAVDYNRNGRRDYSEPILKMFSERYEDTGLGENDEYDWQTNPTGTKGNWLYDEGEPFEDNGLDGVPNTGDYGEGNGKFDYNPNVVNYMAQNPRFYLRDMDEGQLRRLNIWADAGIRDFLMSAGATNWLWGELGARVGSDVARSYDSFNTWIPADRDSYDFLKLDVSKKSIGQHAYLRYGSADASQKDIDRGDGNHVGPPDQILNRFLTAIHFAQSRYYEPNKDEVIEEELFGLIKSKTYHSDVLDQEKKYGIVLPPGYDLPGHEDETYPVMYFLHGQGMESDDLLASAILFFGYMGQSAIPDTQRRRQSDWAKFILVFPDSECAAEECHQGNFNTNHRGVDGDGKRFQDGLYELMAYVEHNYRTRQPVEVPWELLEE